MKEKNNSLTKHFLIIGLVMFLLTTSLSYAYFANYYGPAASADININITDMDELYLTVSNDLNLHLTQFNLQEAGGNLTDSATATASFKGSKGNSKIMPMFLDPNEERKNYYVYFNIQKNTYIYTQDENTPEIILTITKPDGEVLKEVEGLKYVTYNNIEGFDITTKQGLYTIAKLYNIKSSGKNTIQNWDFKVTFVNLETNQKENAGKELDAKIIIQDQEYTDNNLASKIITTGINDNSLVKDDLNNYYFIGDNPNNYICLSDDCNDDLYQIIGIFNETGNYQVKLIKVSDRDLPFIEVKNYFNEEYLSNNPEYLNYVVIHSWDYSSIPYEYLNNLDQINDFSNVSLVGAFGGLISLSDYLNLKNYNAIWLNLQNNWLINGESEEINYYVNEFEVIDKASVSEIKKIRPVVYLNSNVLYKSGMGSIDDPYKIMNVGDENE